MASNLNLYCVGDKGAIEFLNNFSLFTFNVFQIANKAEMGSGVMGEFKKLLQCRQIIFALTAWFIKFVCGVWYHKLMDGN